MNFWSFRFLKQVKENEIVRVIERVKRAFKGARFEVYLPSTKVEGVIFMLGQIHPVKTGKISNRVRRQIVNCQVRLCKYYAFFEKQFEVRMFGGEGYYGNEQHLFVDKESWQIYKHVGSGPLTAKKILVSVGKDWQRYLQNGDKRVERYVDALNGLTVFNYLNEKDVYVYAVEGEVEYRKVLKGVEELGREIMNFEKKNAFVVVRQRGGKVKNDKEAKMIMDYNKLVEKFNSLIRSDVRERATLEILRERAVNESGDGVLDPPRSSAAGRRVPTVIVFTMGVGHRQNYLRLRKDFFRGTKTAFVVVTPPELRRSWFFVGVLLFLLLLFLAFWMFV